MAEVTFGEWLKRRRKAEGWTQEQLADQVGCSTIALRKLEAEERRPSAQIVERLAEIFHIPPTEQTNFLRFARGDWKSAPGEGAEDFPWRASSRSLRSNLPAKTTSLVGREKGIAELREYLNRAEIRLVTLTGPPGVGKTQLCLEAAREALDDFHDGVFFVPLAPLDDASLVTPTIVQALGFVETKNQPPLAHLQDSIGEKQMLLVLDNLEHILEDAAPLVSDLLAACPRLTILATSRESLRIPGEWLYPVPALEIPTESLSMDTETALRFPALTLFVERARAVRPDFALDAENIQAVTAICAQLDGLPLAIELVAARVRLMSPPALLQRFRGQFMLHADGMRAPSPRQKTLHDAIRWSHDLLAAEEQTVFAGLSVFAGGFTLEAAEAIFSPSIPATTVSNLILSLLDKSLLQRSTDRQAPHEPRFHMLVTIRHFALERLQAMGHEAETRAAHLGYFLDLAGQADREIHGPRQVEWMDRLDLEIDNFRAALHWCVSEQKTPDALRLLGALHWGWLVRNHSSEARTWFHQIRALPGVTAYPALYARVLNDAGHRDWLLSDFDEARSVLHESQAIWQGLGAEGERGLAAALGRLGMVAHSSEWDTKKARALFEESLARYQRHDDRWGIAFALFSLGRIGVERHDAALAPSLLEQSLEQFRQLGDIWGMSRVSEFLGQYFLNQGNYEKARLFFEQHLQLDESARFKGGVVIALANLGNLYRYQGDYHRARQFYERARDLSQTYGIDDWGWSLYSLAMLALQESEYSLAVRLFTDYFHASRGSFEKISACDFFAAMAAIAARMDQPERAAKLQGAAQALLETTDYRIAPFDAAEFDRQIRIAREQLGDESFERLAAEGRALTLQDAVTYALESPSSFSL